MKQPVILLVDDDPQVISAIKRDMRGHYRNDYRVIATDSAKEALELVQDMKLKGELLAMVISDQRMPEMEGVVLLEHIRQLNPKTRRVLLTAYSDIEAAIKAINDVKLDYYLMKPWHPPTEKLFPVVDELLDEWQAGYRPDHEGIRIIGFQWSPKSHHIKEFFSGNLVPFTWIDVEDQEKEAAPYLESAKADRANLPLVVFSNGTFALDPELPELAEQIGLNIHASADVYDVAIVGAGPSGLAAAVYGASEGLRTLLIEKHAPGGQAGTSTRIENYLGFHKGVSGAELTRRALTQASRFGTELLTTQGVKGVRIKGQYKQLTLDNGSEVNTKAVVITTGVSYRMLQVPGIERFTGAGVYYGAAAVEAHACRGGDVYVVGGGNSAGQAAMFLSGFARQVNIIIRGADLSSTASSYLIDQIHHTPNINVLPYTEVAAVNGGQMLETITLRNNRDGSERTEPAKALFIYIGARPSTDWLGDTLLLDQKGFILTGRELMNSKRYSAHWKLEREPYLLETSVPGIFASGDVRSGAMARIASAVGEGAMSIKQVHEYLASG